MRLFDIDSREDYLQKINSQGGSLNMAIEALEQEPVVRCKDCISKPNNTCEVDLISREDAMGAVQDHFNADGFKGYYDGQKMMDRITALPSAEPKTGEWIPFNEKLPREHAQYLVCFESGECFVYWLKDSDWVRDMIEKEGAIAWMPLPMPYREGREDYELATEQMEHDVMYEPTYNSEDGSM